IAVASDLMPLGDDRLGGRRVALGDPATGVEGRLDALLLQYPEDPPDRRVRPVLGLGVLLVIHFSVRTGPHVLAALEIEGQGHRNPAAVGPRESVVLVVFLKHRLFLLALWRSCLT